MYCAAWGDLVGMRKRIEKDGLAVEGHRGVQRKHPLLSALNQASAQVRALCAEFGMTPMARGRMNLAVDPLGAEEDEFDSWLRDEERYREENHARLACARAPSLVRRCDVAEGWCDVSVAVCLRAPVAPAEPLVAVIEDPAFRVAEEDLERALEGAHARRRA